MYSTVILLLPSCGGTGNCDIRYEDGELIRFCSDCHDKIYCAVCCKNVHKHPARPSHNYKSVGLATTPLSSSDDSTHVLPGATSLAESSMEYLDNAVTDPWDDDFTDSPK